MQHPQVEIGVVLDQHRIVRRVLRPIVGLKADRQIPAMPETLAAAVGAGEPKATVEAATWPFPMGPTTYPPLTIRPGAGEAVWPATAKEIRKNAGNKALGDIKPPLLVLISLIT